MLNKKAAAINSYWDNSNIYWKAFVHRSTHTHDWCVDLYAWVHAKLAPENVTISAEKKEWRLKNNDNDKNPANEGTLNKKIKI